MTMVRRTSPFGELLSLRQAMDRLFEDSYVRPRDWAGGGAAAELLTLPLDIYATEESLVVEAALPGIKPEDVEITVTGDTLSITGSSSQEERREQGGYLFREQGGYLFQELRRGTFSRSVALPADLDTEAAQAEFDNGLLKLRIPKAEQAKPRQIKISPSDDGPRNVTGKMQPTQPASSPGTDQQ